MRGWRPEALAGVEPLAERYDTFFLDQFGVLHDGQAPYPGVRDALAGLKAAGKRIVLLSNSGKRARVNAERLRRLGFDETVFDLVLTSGEVAWTMLRDGRAGTALPAGARCLLLSRDGETSAIDGLDLVATEDSREAAVILLAGSRGDEMDLGAYEDMLRPAAERGVPCICTNPDKIMLTASGQRFGAGRIAELYRQMGGAVTWIGKPHPEIYRAALEAMGGPAAGRVVCVGDSVEHDIAGGQAAGLDTALVLSGILLGTGSDGLADLFSSHRATPDFIMPRFARAEAGR